MRRELPYTAICDAVPLSYVHPKIFCEQKSSCYLSHVKPLLNNRMMNTRTLRGVPFCLTTGRPFLCGRRLRLVVWISPDRSETPELGGGMAGLKEVITYVGC